MKWVELYAGGGGAALGSRAEGGDGVAYVEWGKDACATLRAAGFGPVFEMDVDEWTRDHGANFLDASGMWSSFPCQCWSTAGKRLGAKDPRNGWPPTVRAIDAVCPRWFVAENVLGLQQHSKKHCGDVNACPGCYFGGVILPQLRERFAWVGVWRIDAASVGVPQHRRRLFMVAGPHAATAPKPTHAAPDKCRGLFGTLKPWRTLGEALGLRGIVGTGHNTDLKGGGRGPHEVSTERPSPTLRCRGSRGGAPLYVVGGDRNAALLGRPSLTVTTTEGNGSTPNPEQARKLRKASDGLMLATGRRVLTVAECADLQGFPPDYPWQGTKTAIYRQIGNAVPPALAAAVVAAVHRAHHGR